jgi:hypothetical protein
MEFQIVDTFNDEPVGEVFEANNQKEADATLGPVPRNEGFIVKKVE